jgi:excisionase family DNA binding protein
MGISIESPVLISVKQLAALCGLTPRTVWRHLSSGKLPKHLTLGGAIRFRKTDVDCWVALGCPDRATFETLNKNV